MISATKGTELDGILLVDKEEGLSSFGVVKKVRSFLGVKKAGHAGSLDPFATGLLVILLGQGTRLSSYLMAGEKIYIATMRLGVETDTMDLTGRVIRERPVPPFEVEYLKKTARDFIGEIEQIPPIFSALKYRGKRAYELARKGIAVELQKRKITIYHLEILSVALPDIHVIVNCSMGTYIRSLATDFGRRLEVGAHLQSLRRISSGFFHIERAVSSKAIGSTLPFPLLQEKIIPMRDALSHIQEIEIETSMAQHMKNGYQPDWGELCSAAKRDSLKEGPAKMLADGNLIAMIAIGPLDESGRRKVEVRNVFH